MVIVLNGATIKLNKTKRNAVIRDKYGHFIGMKNIQDLIAELRLLRDNGDGIINLYEIEQFLDKPKTEQRELDMSVRF